MSNISKPLTEKNSRLDVSTLTKKGIKRVLITPWSDVSLDGVVLNNSVQYDITFPELNGRLPSYVQIVSNLENWLCGCRIMELGGKGDPNYFNITKENNNGVPTY